MQLHTAAAHQHRRHLMLPLLLLQPSTARQAVVAAWG
jgi:hypothetical protein